METDKKTSFSNLSPEELEAHIDRLASEMKTEGAEYEVTPAAEKRSFLMRLRSCLSPRRNKKKTGKR